MRLNSRSTEKQTTAMKNIRFTVSFLTVFALLLFFFLHSFQDDIEKETVLILFKLISFHDFVRNLSYDILLREIGRTG